MKSERRNDINENNQTLLRLVRIGSGLDSAISDTILPDSPNWQTLYSLALHQGASAILLDAIGLLPSETRPPKPVLMQWICQATMMELMYVKHRERIVELADFYKQNGIRMLLLKGYGCSLCYPKPEHRPTGDLDVYLFGKQEEADIWLRSSLALRCIVNTTNILHSIMVGWRWRTMPSLLMMCRIRAT